MCLTVLLAWPLKMRSIGFPETSLIFLNVMFVGSVHHESMSIIVHQDATMYSLLYFCKLLYMFRVITSPFIRRTYNINYSIWHWSNLGKCSVWSQLKMRGMDRSLLPLADFTHCIFLSLTSARCCNYSYMFSWWWVKLWLETCKAVYRNIIKCT